MNVKVTYEAMPIRHIAVQCNKCKKWFNGRDITKDLLQYDFDIYNAIFTCPVCNKNFGAYEYKENSSIHIKEISYPEIYKDCLQRKETWE